MASGDALRAILAGIGGGASSLGASLQEKEKAKQALQRLIEQRKTQEGEYGTPFDAADDQGNPSMYQANKRGETRKLGIKPVPKAPSDNLDEYLKKPQRVQSTDPETGQTKWAWLKPGEEAPGPSKGGEGERAGMAAAFLSRLKMGKADFDNGMDFIRNYHKDLSEGKRQITPAMMAGQAAAGVTQNPEAHGITGVINNALGSAVSGLANKAVAKSDPDYQRYVNLLNSMSLAMTEVLPRPTQQILGIEKGINTAKAGDPPERLADIQHRLDLAYQFMFSDPEGMLRKGPATPSGTAAPTTPPPISTPGAEQKSLQDRITELKAAGKSKDEARAILKAEGYTVP